MSDQTSREAFEKHHRVSAEDRNEDGGYKNTATNYQWHLWQLTWEEAWQAAMQERQWKPIEEAPKDGTPVLLRIRLKPNDERYTVIEGHFSDLYDSWDSIAGLLNNPKPEHFQPLPAPPEK